MPEGGKLTIETENVELDEDYARQHVGVKRGPYVRMTVSDTGHGMDQEVQAHIFEPFFTTKEPGKGTGLGLSTAYGIVKQSGGNIWVYSEPGEGTTFKIYLPCVEEETEPITAREVLREIPRGTETVLVVEDEEQVRELLQRILEANGYHVLAAAEGEEALTLARQHKRPIQMMVTDVVMPKMNGKKLATFMLKQRPEMKVLYMSGYTDEAIVHHGVLEPGTPFLEKPFTPETLSRKLREILDA